MTDKMKRSFFQAAVVSILLYGCTTWMLTKRLEKKLDGNYTRMLRAILNKSWRQHPHKAPTIRLLYSHILLHNTYTNISGNIVDNNIRTSMNKRTLFFIKIYLSHFILERVDVGCVWEVSWRRGQTATYWPKVPLTIAALLPHSGWAAQPWVTEGHKPSVCKLILTLASCPQLTPSTTGTRTRTD